MAQEQAVSTHDVLGEPGIRVTIFAEYYPEGAGIQSSAHPRLWRFGFWRVHFNDRDYIDVEGKDSYFDSTADLMARRAPPHMLSQVTDIARAQRTGLIQDTIQLSAHRARRGERRSRQMRESMHVVAGPLAGMDFEAQQARKREMQRINNERTKRNFKIQSKEKK